MRQNRSFAILIFLVLAAIGAGLAYAAYKPGNPVPSIIIGVAAFLVALAVASSIQVADQWDKAVILRLGHPLAPGA